jgi:hypothetical protein
MALVLAACVPPSSLPSDARASMKHVAIVSVIGDQIEFARLGVTVFGNEVQRTTADWKLDSIATEALARHIRQRRPDIEIVQASFDARRLAPIYRRESFTPYVDPRRVDGELRRMLAGTGVDTVLVITRDKDSGPGAGNTGPIEYEGPGLYMVIPVIGPPTRVKPFVKLRLMAIEASTMKVLTSAYIMVEESKYFDGVAWSRDRPVPTPFKAAVTLPLTVEQSDFLRRELETLVPVAVGQLATQIGL